MISGSYRGTIHHLLLGRHRGERGLGLALGFAGCLVAAEPSAHGQSAIGDDALPGLIRTDTADELAVGPLLAVTSGYGYTEETLNEADSHHRAFGRLTGSYRIVPNFALALRFDGRYDKHFGDNGNDDSWVGDPRLIARYRQTLTPTLSAAMQVGLWAPGSEAPSIRLSALSLETSAALSYQLPSRPLLLAMNLGYRLDRSASSVANDEALSLADRMSLGVSDYNAALVALGASYRFGELQAVVEWSLDLLHGSGAPAFRESPMRIGASLQVALSEVLALTAQTEVRVSRVSAADVASMLLPFEPRVQAMAGVQMRFGGASKVHVAIVDDTELPDDTVVDIAPVVATLRGQVLTGTQAIANAKVSVRVESGESHELVTDETGGFSMDLPVGALLLSIEADGFESKEESISLVTDAAPIEIYLDAILPPGQLRGVVRSFRGKALKAELRIEPGLKVVQTEADGSFEIDLPPGDYEVSISVDRFKSQSRQIHIDEDGVTIMNVDLRR